MWDLSFPTKDQTHILCIGRRILNHWTTREVPTSNCKRRDVCAMGFQKGGKEDSNGEGLDSNSRTSAYYLCGFGQVTWFLYLSLFICLMGITTATLCLWGNYEYFNRCRVWVCFLVRHPRHPTIVLSLSPLIVYPQKSDCHCPSCLINANSFPKP